ncbi:microtubule-binding protein MIP-T3-domain-containing protein, partial [Dunaliella salina]
MQDKDAKVAYLQKIISVVSIVLGQPVPAKPQKIVAGLEPENTNLFFQMLGRACRMDNGAQAVQQVLGDGAPAQAPPARPASRPSSQQQAERAPPPADAAPPEDAKPKEKKREHHSKEHHSKEHQSKEHSSKEHRSKEHRGKERPSSASRHRSSSKGTAPSVRVRMRAPCVSC